jgi:release factor glutamine methyltransferase
LKNIYSKLADQLKKQLLSFQIEQQEAEVESDLILFHVSGLNRAQRIVSDQQTVPESCMAEIERIMEQRSRRFPIQYCLGKTKFMGMDFEVESGVLIPRVDTETLVNVVLELLSQHQADSQRSRQLRIAEIGVGAGSIAISLLKKIANARVWACDVSEKAIALSRRNAESLGVSNRLELVLGDWRATLCDRFDIIVSNPPYISRACQMGLAPEIACYEPTEALFADDDDGLSFYKSFARLLGEHLVPGQSFLACEIGDGQAKFVGELFSLANWRQIKIHRDINGMERVFSAVAPSPSSKSP